MPDLPGPDDSMISEEDMKTSEQREKEAATANAEVPDDVSQKVQELMSYVSGQTAAIFYEVKGSGNYSEDEVRNYCRDFMVKHPELLDGDEVDLVEAIEKDNWSRLSFSSAVEALSRVKLTEVMSHYMQNPGEEVRVGFGDGEVANCVEEMVQLGTPIKLPLSEEQRGLVLSMLERLHSEAQQKAIEALKEQEMIKNRGSWIRKTVKLKEAGKLERGENLSQEEKVKRATEIATDIVPTSKDPKQLAECSLVRERFVPVLITEYDRLGLILPIHFFIVDDDEEKKVIKQVAKKAAEGTFLARWI